MAFVVVIGGGQLLFGGSTAVGADVDGGRLLALSGGGLSPLALLLRDCWHWYGKLALVATQHDQSHSMTSLTQAAGMGEGDAWHVVD